MEEDVEPNNDHEFWGRFLKKHMANLGLSCESQLKPSHFQGGKAAFLKLLAECEGCFLLCFMNLALFHPYVNSCKGASLKSCKCWSISTQR